jgi:hypothetical protein
MLIYAVKTLVMVIVALLIMEYISKPPDGGVS